MGNACNFATDGEEMHFENQVSNQSVTHFLGLNITHFGRIDSLSMGQIIILADHKAIHTTALVIIKTMRILRMAI